jgi:DNA polymerase-3 subunit gamma/tau
VEWEALLVEMLRLLHQIAMVQLLPTSLNDDDESNALRLRELARVVPPADLQLYYQTLLMGRKDLPIAPDRRMGVEMTLLRALAFHPKAAVAEPIARPALTQQTAPVAPAQTSPAASGPSPLARQPAAQPASPSPAAARASHTASPVAQQTQQQMPEQTQQQVAAQPQMAAPAAAPQHSPSPDATPDTALSSSTSQLLQARTQLLRQGANKPKKREPAAPGARPANSALERLASVTERSQQRIRDREPAAPVKEEAYRWKAVNQPVEVAEPVATPKALRSALEHEKTPELAARLAEEAQQRDPWAAEIAILPLPKLVQQLALNAWKETTETGVCLHLRSSQRHLNSPSAQQVLSDALSQHAGQRVELSVVEDDNSSVLTPLEWRQAIYEEKLAQARQSITCDTHIQTLQRFFDADLDEESIRPV